ncbi:MAG: hypothetical protein V3S69_00570 [Dehalococcoidales bacterium]
MNDEECRNCNTITMQPICPGCEYPNSSSRYRRLYGHLRDKRKYDRKAKDRAMKAAISRLTGLGAMLLMTCLGCGEIKTNQSISEDYATEIVYQYELNHVLTYSEKQALTDIAERQILTAIEERESNGL